MRTLGCGWYIHSSISDTSVKYLLFILTPSTGLHISFPYMGKFLFPLTFNHIIHMIAFDFFMSINLLTTMLLRSPHRQDHI